MSPTKRLARWIPVLSILSMAGVVAPLQANSATFSDVPESHWAFQDIQALSSAGYAIPCTQDGTKYCPDFAISRSDWATMIERGAHGGTTEPPYPAPVSATFADVPPDSPAFGWIESLWQDRLTTGCGSSPLIFCPASHHTRAEAIVQLLRMKYGSGYTPPPISASAFKDVAVDAWYAPWIQAGLLNNLTDCNTDMQTLSFRPTDAMTRAEAACMFVRAIGISPLPTPNPSPLPSSTASATVTSTVATATPTASNTPESLPSPTETATAVDLSGQICPNWVHARYVTIGPDGKTYPTWHPQVDPVYHCMFDHDHGDDPRTSLANSTMPAFGYIGAAIGKNEPHAGFKVYVVNRGDKNDEGRVAQVSSRIVMHMGTGGPKRFTTEFHSLQYDMVAPDGHFVHIAGMADTGVVGSICTRNASAPNRTVTTLPGTGCDVSSLYEIWGVSLRIGSKLNAMVSVAVFDPITVMDPKDPGKLIYTADVPGFSKFGSAFFGCNREAYHGPIYWRNAGGATSYRTDAYGNIDPNGTFIQSFSAVNDIGIRMSNDQNLFKERSDNCAPGLSIHN